jgi:hypothetical protein
MGDPMTSIAWLRIFVINGKAKRLGKDAEIRIQDALYEVDQLNDQLARTTLELEKCNALIRMALAHQIKGDRK